MLTAVALAIAVSRSLSNPAKRQTFARVPRAGEPGPAPAELRRFLEPTLPAPLTMTFSGIGNAGERAAHEVAAALAKVTKLELPAKAASLVESAQAAERKAAALADIQRRFIQNPRTRHPFYWAPFTIIGDPL